MTGDERSALLLAARLLESGLAPEEPVAGGGGHIGVGFALAARLRRVAGDGERCRQMIASLRSAAAAASERPLTPA